MGEKEKHEEEKELQQQKEKEEKLEEEKELQQQKEKEEKHGEEKDTKDKHSGKHDKHKKGKHEYVQDLDAAESNMLSNLVENEIPIMTAAEIPSVITETPDGESTTAIHQITETISEDSSKKKKHEKHKKHKHEKHE